MSSGSIGENFVISELLRLKYKITIPVSPQNPDWDILVIEDSKGNTKNIRLQVKAVTWQKNSNTNPSIRGHFFNKFDYLVIVVIGYYRTQKYAVYVIPESDIKKATQTGSLPKIESESIFYKKGTGNKKSTIPFSTFKNDNVRQVFNKKYRNKWERM